MKEVRSEIMMMVRAYRSHKGKNVEKRIGR